MTAETRILICGGRNYTDWQTFTKVVFEVLEKLNLLEQKYLLPKNVTIISGGATGADTLAADFAVVYWTGYKEFKADWKHYGRSAGPKRNRQMLVEGQPHYVIAFPGGRGTANMKGQARKFGLPIYVVDETGNITLEGRN